MHTTLVTTFLLHDFCDQKYLHHGFQYEWTFSSRKCNRNPRHISIVFKYEKCVVVFSQHFKQKYVAIMSKIPRIVLSCKIHTNPTFAIPTQNQYCIFLPSYVKIRNFLMTTNSNLHQTLNHSRQSLETLSSWNDLECGKGQRNK